MAMAREAWPNDYIADLIILILLKDYNRGELIEGLNDTGVNKSGLNDSGLNE